MKKKIISTALPIFSSLMGTREDVQLMKQLVKKYTGGNTFEKTDQIQKMATDFNVDPMEALSWTINGFLPSKYFERAKEILG
jgi:hypothetical protein